MSVSLSDFRTATQWPLLGARSTTLSRLAALLLLLTAMALVIGLAWRIQRHLTAIESHQSQTHELQRELDEFTQAPARPPGGARNGVAANQDNARVALAIDLLNTPWIDILQAIEQHTPEDVAILSLEPGGSGNIKIQSESPKLDRLLAHATDLQDTGPFGKLSLRRHETNEKDANQPARLTFELNLITRGAP